MIKKNKKTTDSILKDIFDPIHQAEETSAHPLADLTASVSVNDAQVLKNSILSSAPINRVESYIEDKIEAAAVEVRVEPPAKDTIPVPVIEKPKEADLSGAKVLNIAAVIAGVLALVAALLILGVIWRGQEAKPGLAPAAPTISAQALLAPHPVLVKIDQLGHEGIRFKNYSVKNNKLMLRGFVPNQALLVKFINSMNASPYFKKTWISSIQEAKVSTYQKFYEFQIYADIRS